MNKMLQTLGILFLGVMYVAVLLDRGKVLGGEWLLVYLAIGLMVLGICLWLRAIWWGEPRWKKD